MPSMEPFDNTEAIANLASIYNTGEMSVTNMVVGDKLNVAGNSNFEGDLNVSVGAGVKIGKWRIFEDENGDLRFQNTENNNNIYPLTLSENLLRTSVPLNVSLIGQDAGGGDKNVDIWLPDPRAQYTTVIDGGLLVKEYGNYCQYIGCTANDPLYGIGSTTDVTIAREGQTKNIRLGNDIGDW